MKRRQFLKAAGLGAAASTIAAPAIAQSMPDIGGACNRASPKSLDTIYGGAEVFAKYVADATDGKFQIQRFAAGEIVGQPRSADAVGNGTVEMAHTCSYYYFGKDPTFSIGTAVPFGLNSRQMNAWLYHGGGNDLLNEFYAKHNLYGLPGGNTGVQMGGWFRKEIKTVADLQGLKMRIAGLAGLVLAEARRRAAADPRRRHLPGARARHDRRRRVGRPLRRREARLLKVAPFYYYPGFWEGGPTIHFMFNNAKLKELPKSYQAIVTAAAAYANIDMQAKYDARNPAALRRLVGAGTQLRPFSQEVLEAGLQGVERGLRRNLGQEPRLQEDLRHPKAFRGEEYLWFQVAEYTYDTSAPRLTRWGCASDPTRGPVRPGPFSCRRDGHPQPGG